MARTDVLCIGGATIDRKYRALGRLMPGTSNPVEGVAAFGGVARNVCETLLRLGVSAGLATLVGDDEGGRALKAHLAALGGDVSAIEAAPGRRTAEYIAALDSHGGLALGLADMGVFDALDAAWIGRLAPRLAVARWVFADCNLPAPALAALLSLAHGASFRLAVDPVSVAKAARLPEDLTGVGLLVLNRDEAEALAGPGDAAETIRRLRARGAASVVLTAGAGAIHLDDGAGPAALPVPAAEVSDVTGAGDALIGALLAGLVAGQGLSAAIAPALGIAALTVASPATVRPDLSPALLQPGRRSAA
jgi:pseudouridine kinase